MMRQELNQGNASVPAFSDRSPEWLQSRYMAQPDPGQRADPDPTLQSSFVDRVIGQFVHRNAGQRGVSQTAWFDLVFNRAWDDIWSRFASIVESFRELRDRPQDYATFEKFLAVSIQHAVISAVRHVRLDKGIGGRPPEPSYGFDPMPDRDSVALTAVALSRLPEQDVALLRRRMVDRVSLDALAAETGAPKSKLNRLLFRVRLHFETLIVEIVVTTRLKTDLPAAHRFAALIASRCDKGAPCHMYRVDCPRAQLFETHHSDRDSHDLMDAFIAYVKDSMALYRLPTVLARCVWANNIGAHP